MASVSACQFLKVPPFPGARQDSLCERAGAAIQDGELDRLSGRIRQLKVGGCYWGQQPALPPAPYALVRIRDPDERFRRFVELGRRYAVVQWVDSGWPKSSETTPPSHTVAGDCDPWHLLAGAETIAVDEDDDAAVLAFVAGVPSIHDAVTEATRERFREIASAEYRNPFTGGTMDFEAAAELCGGWRRLIDSNRGLAAAVGFAFWKRKTVAPLLWNGVSDVDFAPAIRSIEAGAAIAVWKSKTAPETLAELARREARLVEVEDGFVRSIGLGADCVPPLSVVVDPIGIYFDPSGPSELEQILQEEVFAPDMIERARRLREQIVELGISKYAIGETALERRSPDKRHLLVTGQVEDDRAVTSGGGPATNLCLLERVRSGNPDAYIIYKPHPDVEAGHRRGAIADRLSLNHADEIVRNTPISSLIAMVDEVHVNTSLAGFEALLREKPVTTYGVPFYAGWGVSRDLGPVPERRTRRRSLDELVAAALILYPRHVDPVTGLPCSPEILIERLASSSLRPSDWGLVQLRRIQGQWNRAMAAFRA